MPAEEDDRTICPICHVVDTGPEFPEARGPARIHPLVRCRRCGLVFQERVGINRDTERERPPVDARAQNRFGRGIEALIRQSRLSRVRLAARLMPPAARVLDIGCGRGLYLKMLQDRGYEVRGTELSLPGADPGVPIDLGDVTPDRYPAASFDLISMWHVLEHLPSPDVTLEACARALRPGGVLLIAVPNFGSVQARFGGEHWLHLDLPRHRFQFTRSTLERLLTSRGFDIERVRTGQWEMDPFGLVQTILNRLGLRHNAMFDTLRNGEAIKRDLPMLWRAAMLVIFPIGMALAVPLSLLFRLLGRAGTLIVVARVRSEHPGRCRSSPAIPARG
jgi:SAM-dependent methyltransferase